MNLHAAVDDLTINLIASLSGQLRFFADSVDSPGYAEHLERIVLDVPGIGGEGVYEVRASGLVSDLDPAFAVGQWKGDRYPTIIYHHGSNERPLEYSRIGKNSFNRVLWSHRDEIPANLVVVRAPFHQSTKDYSARMRDLAGFAAMLSTAAKLIEALVVRVRERGSRRVTVAGISLGGWVANLHRAYYNSADGYVPLLAGAALEDVFIHSSYRKLTGKLAFDNPDAISQTLDFEADFQRVGDDNVYPVLARYDQIIRFNRQRMCYGDVPIVELDKGHVTGALASGFLRKHILRHC